MHGNDLRGVTQVPMLCAGGDHMSDRKADGTRIRREVLGTEHVDRAQAQTTGFDAPFQDLITEGAWLDIAQS